MVLMAFDIEMDVVEDKIVESWGFKHENKFSKAILIIESYPEDNRLNADYDVFDISFEKNSTYAEMLGILELGVENLKSAGVR